MRHKKKKQRSGKQSKEVAEKTKKQILKAALKVFAREGFPNGKLRDIAEIAETTHSLIRHHFGSKDDLWKAVVVHGLQMHENRLRQMINSLESTDPVERYKMIITAHIHLVAENTELVKMLLHDRRRNDQNFDDIAEKQKDIYRLTEPFFKEAQACGYFKGFDHDSFAVYMTSIADMPIISSDLSNKSLKEDILSEKGIEMHAKRVINFLFHKDE